MPRQLCQKNFSTILGATCLNSKEKTSENGSYKFATSYLRANKQVNRLARSYVHYRIAWVSISMNRKSLLFDLGQRVPHYDFSLANVHSVPSTAQVLLQVTCSYASISRLQVHQASFGSDIGIFWYPKHAGSLLSHTTFLTSSFNYCDSMMLHTVGASRQHPGRRRNSFGDIIISAFHSTLISRMPRRKSYAPKYLQASRNCLNPSIKSSSLATQTLLAWNTSKQHWKYGPSTEIAVKRLGTTTSRRSSQTLQSRSGSALLLDGIRTALVLCAIRLYRLPE